MSTKNKQEYKGKCLCGETTFLANSIPINPHLCSCTMCQKSSGAPTVAWVEFPLKYFIWTKAQPALYQSSAKTQRCFCHACGSFLGAMDDDRENISITIMSLQSPDLIIPNKKHSYKESKPVWWKVDLIE